MVYIRAMTNLSSMLETAWARLSDGAAPGQSPWSAVSVATTGTDGRPRQRTVILRRVDPVAGSLWFHTDQRSPKVKELSADPRLSLLGYDRAEGLQIRVEGRATLHRSSPERRKLWDDAAEHSRIAYRRPFGPGEALQAPDDGDSTALMRSPGDHDAGLAHFCAVEVAAEKVEALLLAEGGHRRAVFEVENGWAGCWLAP